MIGSYDVVLCNYYYFTPLRVFHTSINLGFLIEACVTASYLKSPGLLSVFWPIFFLLLLFTPWRKERKKDKTHWRKKEKSKKDKIHRKKERKKWGKRSGRRRDRKKAGEMFLKTLLFLLLLLPLLLFLTLFAFSHQIPGEGIYLGDQVTACLQHLPQNYPCCFLHCCSLGNINLTSNL